MIIERHCERCERTTRQEISASIGASQNRQFGWWCLSCRWWVKSKQGGIWIGRELLEARGIDLDLVPVVQMSEMPR